MHEKNTMTKGAAWKEKSIDMDELKPCPFCGCTQVLVSQRDGVPLIACNECWGENWTIEAWNRREEVTALDAEVERLKAAEKAVAEERGEEFRQYRRSAEAYEKEAIRLKEAIKIAHADGASALIASFENVDPKARICELEAEITRLKEGTKRLPELTWKAERYEAICDIFGYARGSDVGPAVESVKKEWAQLRSGTTISIKQAQEASQLASQAAAVHAVRACARWLRQNSGWMATVEYAATEMESHMTQNINQTYGTSIIPEESLPEKHYATAAAQERVVIVKWIEKQVDRYAGDTLRSDRERALVGNVLRMVAMQIRDGEHHDVSL